MSEHHLTAPEIDAALGQLELTPDEAVEVMSRIAAGTIGLLLYGSRARGDHEASSDFDILRYTSSWNSPTFKCGRVSVSSYTRDQLESASETLFGTHLNRDGRILAENGDELTLLIDRLQPANPALLLARVTQYSTILVQPDAVKAAHFTGLVRLARYLLRTAVYASAMNKGTPCFSVRQLAQRFNEPRLATLLASDPAVTGPPSIKLLDELTTRLTVIIGPLPEHDYGSLEALAVATWDTDRNLAALAIRAGSEDDQDSINYSELPKVLL
ncbi:nucleotidyltransferase domain-containing protein [Prescottella equi]|uniref:nucleotidyltransferase domain-containing protein n=1 Tax=Rhodococcus hoagii TaxID=43767 RepID=UPI001C74C601|nr:nucleotidyltransferase domain-containing protein [Prescottella equi]BCN42060.1 hypothetical protein RE9414_03400 [Prescottella equi]